MDKTICKKDTYLTNYEIKNGNLILLNNNGAGIEIPLSQINIDSNSNCSNPCGFVKDIIVNGEYANVQNGLASISIGSETIPTANYQINLVGNKLELLKDNNVVDFVLLSTSNGSNFDCNSVKNCIGFTQSLQNGTYNLVWNSSSNTLVPQLSQTTLNNFSINVNGNQIELLSNGNVISSDILPTSGNSSTNNDPIRLVNNSNDLSNLQSIATGNQMFQYTGVNGLVGGVNLVNGITYSITDTGKISDLSTDVATILIEAGSMTGNTSQLYPVMNRNMNGCSVYRLRFRVTQGSVNTNDTIVMLKNGLAVGNLTLNTSNELSETIFSTPVQLLETDEISFTLPNNSTLGGVLAIYNVENTMN